MALELESPACFALETASSRIRHPLSLTLPQTERPYHTIPIRGVPNHPSTRGHRKLKFSQLSRGSADDAAAWEERIRCSQIPCRKSQASPGLPSPACRPSPATTAHLSFRKFFASTFLQAEQNPFGRRPPNYSPGETLHALTSRAEARYARGKQSTWIVLFHGKACSRRRSCCPSRSW